MAQWLEHDGLLIYLRAVWSRTPFGGFSDKYHVSPLSMLGHCFDVLSMGKALFPAILNLIQL